MPLTPGTGLSHLIRVFIQGPWDTLHNHHLSMRFMLGTIGHITSVQILEAQDYKSALQAVSNLNDSAQAETEHQGFSELP